MAEMTQAEKLLARIASEKGRAVILIVIVGSDGVPVAWAIQDTMKVEGSTINTENKLVV